MVDEKFQKILEQIKDHEKRIRALEVDKNRTVDRSETQPGTGKQVTLAEMIRVKSFKSGQEKIVAIVGYYEKIIRRDSIKEADLKAGWKDGKFDGKYNRNLLNRAIKDGLVRNIDTNLDLSQTGEKFFDNFSKLDAGNNQKGAEKQNKRR